MIGPGDEDEVEEQEEEGEGGFKPNWEHYFIQPHSTCKLIYRTTKENGDSAHLSFLSHHNSIY